MQRAVITDREFAQFQAFIFESAGITMSAAKKSLVSGRLAKRLQHFGLATYGDYYRLLQSGKAGAEAQIAIDLLTTNETYFFREPKHFDFLRKQAEASRDRSQPFRVWSAACSSGEEPYSIAMLLADCLQGRAWDVMGSDISTKVLQAARAGHYSMERARHIPQSYLRRFCLKGIGTQAGTLLIEKSLRSRVQFMQINLNTALPKLGSVDVVFLRNVMIYFNGNTKKEVVERIAELIKPGGYLVIGHSETLNEITGVVRQVSPSIYQRP